MFPGRTKYFASALSAVVIWGFIVFPLRALRAYSAEQILCFRILLSLIFTWFIIFTFNKDALKFDLAYLRSLSLKELRKLYLLIFAAGILITGNWYSFIYATNSVSIRSAAFAYMVCPLITAVGGFIFLKEKATTYKLTAISIAIVSIAILTKGSLRDVFWSVFIAIWYAAYLIIQRLSDGVNKLNMLGFQLIIASIILIPFLFSQPQPLPLEASFWVNVSILALVFTVIPLYLSLHALTGIESSTVGILIYVNPLVAFSVAFIYFDESVTVTQGVAYMLLLVAVMIFNWELLKGIFKPLP